MTKPPTGVVANCIGPVLIAIATLLMLLCSWGTWPDPLVDFGAQLYVPWRISAGQVLYRDLAYYNGPLSSYFNAAMFRMFGVGISTLVWTNLLILIAALVLVYRLACRASGRLAATVCTLTFSLVFAFGQTVRIGNYNWMTPYTHEITHGIVLGLATMAATARYQRTKRGNRLILAGFLLGCVFLTKAEPMAATSVGVVLLLIAGWWIEKTPANSIVKAAAILVGFACAAPLIAWGLLSLAMPPTLALRGTLGSWLWVFDRRVTTLHFYHQVSGLDDIAGNLRVMLDWLLIYALLIGAGLWIGLSWRSGRGRWISAGVGFILVVGWGALRLDQINWSGMITPLPIVLAIVFGMSGFGVIRRKSKAPIRLALIAFAGVLVAKLGFKTCPYHYGFALAMPGTMVLICAVSSELPRWIEGRGGSALVLRSTALAAWLVAIAVMLHLDNVNWSADTTVIAPGTSDEFRGDEHAATVVDLCHRVNTLLSPDGTIVVLPQGLMVNYLTRRITPNRTINFMPPEVLAAGEENILAGFRTLPPDAIVLTASEIHDGSFTLDGHDPYGSATLRWVLENYQPAAPDEVHRKLRLMLRKK